MKIAIINGPNINMLGTRDPDIYGHETYEDLQNLIKNHCINKNIDLLFYQNNHEGNLVDYIQSLYKKCDGIVINPAAYTHYSIAILDALSSVSIPYVEVHISDIKEREDYRKISITSEKAVEIVKGEGLKGYLIALDKLISNINEEE